eukprot:Skav226563  [mRNA]  locus=scaffold1701:54348:55963:- [translate_table: standard]
MSHTDHSPRVAATAAPGWQRFYAQSSEHQIQELQERLQAAAVRMEDEELAKAARWLASALAEIPEQRIWAAERPPTEKDEQTCQEIEWAKASCPSNGDQLGLSWGEVE